VTVMSSQASIVWLTGLPCSGKTTIALALQEKLHLANVAAEVLDGDQIRAQFWPDLKFSHADRNENVRRLGLLASMFARNGVHALVAAVSPYRHARDGVRARAGCHFIEVYVNCPLHICQLRDVKGMYKQAEAGSLPGFTGVGDSFEPPETPDVECLTMTEDIERCVEKLLKAMGPQL